MRNGFANEDLKTGWVELRGRGMEEQEKGKTEE